MIRKVLLLVVLVSSASFTLGLQGASARESPAEIIAPHVRTQGYTCINAKSAHHVPEMSRPHEQVWILHCDNASYLVRLIPDLAAHVERLG